MAKRGRPRLNLTDEERKERKLKQHREYEARKHSERRSDGVCIKCSSPLDCASICRCSECLKKAREVWKDWYSRNRKALQEQQT